MSGVQKGACEGYRARGTITHPQYPQAQGLIDTFITNKQKVGRVAGVD